MPRVSIKATELSNTDVDFIALVKRGANRIPFRLTKSEEEPMLDLFSAGKRLLMKGDTPKVLGVVYTKQADVSAIEALLKAEGIEVAQLQKTESDSVTTLIVKDAETHEAMLVKTGETTALIVSSLRKAFQDFDLKVSPYTSERHVCSPTVAAAIYKNEMNGVLKADVSEIAGKSAAVTKAFDAFISKLAPALPAQAVKMDQELQKAPANSNAQGAGADDQATGAGMGGRENQGARKSDKNLGAGDIDAADAGIPAAAGQAKPAKTDDAGKNGTGSGFELRQGTGTSPRATDDDRNNTEINAKPGQRVSGDSSGMPAGAKAKKDDHVENDGSTNGAQSDLPDKVKAKKQEEMVASLAALAKAAGYSVNITDDGGSHRIDIRLIEPQGEGPSGEGAVGALDTRDQVSDKEITDTTVDLGKPGGATIDKKGIPAKVLAKGEPEAALDDPDKNKDRQLPDARSGAGAAQRDSPTLKPEVGLMQAIAALSKAVSEGLAGMKKDVAEIGSRVGAVEVMAKKTDAALHGTVFNEASGDVVRQARKSDPAGSSIPLIDTGYHRQKTA